MAHAFPVSYCYSLLLFINVFPLCNFLTSVFLQHDELKPLTKTFTNSLSELGNLKVNYTLHREEI